MTAEQNVCEFCGQVLMDGVCNCPGARKQRDEEQRIRNARTELLDVLHTDLVEEGEQPSGRLAELLCNMIPLMLREGVTQVSVTADNVGKVTISYNGSWKIKKQRGVSIERKV